MPRRSQLLDEIRNKIAQDPPRAEQIIQEYSGPGGLTEPQQNYLRREYKLPARKRGRKPLAEGETWRAFEHRPRERQGAPSQEEIDALKEIYEEQGDEGLANTAIDSYNRNRER